MPELDFFMAIAVFVYQPPLTLATDESRLDLCIVRMYYWMLCLACQKPLMGSVQGYRLRHSPYQARMTPVLRLHSVRICSNCCGGAYRCNGDDLSTHGKSG